MKTKNKKTVKKIKAWAVESKWGLYGAFYFKENAERIIEKGHKMGLEYYPPEKCVITFTP
jgi:hypothetical protein